MTHFYIPSEGSDSWKDFLAEPDKQWKKGYSARALAYCWEEAQGFPKSVRKVFKNCPFKQFHTIEFVLGIPEHKVYLPPKSGHPSQNDLFVLGRSQGKLVSICVEGKVSESFGPLVSEWGKEMSSGKRTRLDFICNILELQKRDIKSIRYQLLHRTVSALLEAERFSAPTALVLVHSFSQENEWFEDYTHFVNLFTKDVKPDSISYAGRRYGKKLYLGWVKGEKQYLTR